MKTHFYHLALCLLLLSIVPKISESQIIVTPMPGVTVDDMIELIMGPGVNYENAEFTGADQSSGIFDNGLSAELGIDVGVFLTSGSGSSIPGPNQSASTSTMNGTVGNELLNTLSASVTYDAAVLEFDFIPMNDTLKCWYVFGSEEYSEWVGSSFNDVFGFFVDGPNPNGGDYENENVAIVPGTVNTAVAINNVNNGWAQGGVATTGPCNNCEYFIDNTNGVSLQYDGYTVALPIVFLVVPGETYHFTFAVGDVGDGIYDTGVFIEGYSFKSPGPADFFAFDFLAENNPELEYDVTGFIEDQHVWLEVPEGTDLTALVATYEEHGADVFVNGILQENGVSLNDFTQPLIYNLEGYETASWTVHVDVITRVPDYLFHNVLTGPNPSQGKLVIENLDRMDVLVYNTLGRIVKERIAASGSLTLHDLIPGIYFLRLEKDSQAETRKIVVR